MRYLLPLLFCSSFLMSSANAEEKFFDGELLTFNQVVQLSPQKRMAYIEDLRALIVLFEEQDQKEEVVSTSESHQMYAQVVALLRSISALPSANAVGVVQPKTPHSGHISSTPADDAVIGPPMENPTQKFALPKEVNGGAPQTLNPKLISIVPEHSCGDPNAACKILTAKERASTRAIFRKAGGTACITGGLFSKYNAKGKCEYAHEFPVGAPHDAKGTLFCPRPNTALCNPWLFCFSMPVENPDDPKNPIAAPIRHCEEIGGKKGYNITQRCGDWYDKSVQSGLTVGVTKPDGQKVAAKASACNDPTTIKVPNSLPLQNAWDELNSAMHENYQHLCLQNEDFRALNCNECKVIASRIQAMNQKAVGSGCGATETQMPSKENPVSGGRANH